MNLDIARRTALVFGGSRGMGRACARQLALEGVRVTIAARTEATLRDTATPLSTGSGETVRFAVADITASAGRDAALLACPSPDILINNSDGRPPGAPVLFRMVIEFYSTDASAFSKTFGIDRWILRFHSMRLPNHEQVDPTANHARRPDPAACSHHRCDPYRRA